MNEIPFQSQFEEAKASLPGDLAGVREAAFQHFAESGLPSQRREAWRYTRLSGLTKTALAPLAEDRSQAADAHAHFLEDAINMVFLDGHFDAAASNLDELPDGLSIESLASAASSPAVASMLGHAAGETPDDALVSLNTAMMNDGAVIRIASGANIDQPIHLLFHTAHGGMSHLRNVVIVGDRASAALVETYIGETDETYWNNVVTQIVQTGNSLLRHVKVQNEGTAAWHIAATRLHMTDGDRFDSVIAQLGGLTARHEVNTLVEGEGADCKLAGVSIGTGKQVLDTITQLDHAVPNCTSNQLFKSVLDEGSHAIYQGKVIVRQDAQKTDAQQANHNLLLARTAEASSKPELEIYADDVQCAHGATVGELDQNMLFYLKARGIDEATATQLLIQGFVVEVLDRIENDSVRDHVSAALARKGVA